MPSLSKTAKETKLILKWGVIGLAGIIILVILINLGLSIKRHFFPSPLPAPTVQFGRLPTIPFPQSEYNSKPTYVVNTLSGNLPNLPSQTKVYVIAYNTPDLVDLQTASNNVSQVGFSSTPIALSQNVYQWQYNNEINQTLTMNISSFNFNLTSSFLSNPAVVAGDNIPDPNTAIQTATNFLTSMNSFPGDIDTSKTTTTLLTINNNNLTQASSLSNTQAIQVNFFQQNIDNLPIFYPNPFSSTINILITGGQNQPQVARVQFFHQDIASSYSTYPLKTAQQAFNDLQKGKAYVASISPNASSVSINNVFLAYYLSDQKQNYLMPIIVFKGSNNFVAYDNAINPFWISN